MAKDKSYKLPESKEPKMSSKLDKQPKNIKGLAEKAKMPKSKMAKKPAVTAGKKTGLQSIEDRRKMK